MSEELSEKELIFANEYIKTHNKVKAYMKAYIGVISKLDEIELNNNNGIYEYVDENGVNQTVGPTTVAQTTDYITKSADTLLHRKHVFDYINRKLVEQEGNAIIADKNEVLGFYTSVMRGEILDQFGLEASLSDRITAANQLAKYLILEPMRNATREAVNAQKVTINFKPRKEIAN